MKKYNISDLHKLKKYDLECCSIECIEDKDKILSYLDDYLFNERLSTIISNNLRTIVMPFHEFISKFMTFIREYNSNEYYELPSDFIYKDITSTEYKTNDEFIRCSLFQLIKSTYNNFIDWYIDDYDVIISINFNKYNIKRNFYDVELVQNFEPKRSRHVYCSHTNRCDEIEDMNDIFEFLIASGDIDKKEVNSACSITTISEDEYLSHEIKNYRKTENLCDDCNDENSNYCSVFPIDNKKDLSSIYGNHDIVTNDIYKYTVTVKIDHTGETLKLLFIIGRNAEGHPEVIIGSEEFFKNIVLHIVKTVVGYEGIINKITKLSKYSSLLAADSDTYSAKFFIGLGCIQDKDEAFCINDKEIDKSCTNSSEFNQKNKNHNNEDCEDCDCKYDCGCSPYFTKVEKEYETENTNKTEAAPVKHVMIPLVPIDPKAEIMTLSRLIRERVELLIGGSSEIKITATCRRNDDSPIGFDHKLSIQSNTEMDL